MMYLSLNVSPEKISLWLLHSAAGGGLLLLAVWLVMKRFSQPVLKQRLGEWGLAAAVLVSALSLLPAWLVIPWKGAGVPSPPDAGASSVSAREAVAIMLSDANRPQNSNSDVVADRDGQLPFAAPPHETPISNESSAANWSLSQIALTNIIPWLFSGIGVVYSLGLGIFLARMGMAMLWLRRLVRRAIPAPPEVVRLFADVSSCAATPRLLLAANVRVPISFGLFRPTIVLPIGMCSEVHPIKLRWVLAHEMTHLRRRDAWSGLLCGLAQAVFFFLPWCWAICRQIRLCQEYVADASAVFEEQKEDYAEFLLSLTKKPALPVVTTGVTGDSSDLYRRVTMLVEKPMRIQNRCPRRWLLTAAVVLVTMAVVMSGVSLAGGRGIVVIEKEKVEKKQAKQEDRKGTITIHLRIAPQQDEGQKLHRRILILEKGAGTQIAPGNENEKKKIIIRKQIIKEDPTDNQRIRIFADIEDLKNLENFKNIQQLIKIRSLKGLKNINGNLQSLEKELKKLEGQLGKDVTDRIRKEVQNALKEKSDKKIILKKRKILIAPASRLPGIPRGNVEIEWEIKGTPDLNDLEKSLKKLKGSISQKDLDRIRADIQKAIAAHKKGKVKAWPRLSSGTAGRSYEWRIPENLPRYYQGYKARLGVEINEPSPILADQLNLPEGQGLVVVRVFKGTAAEKAGLKKNDVIVEFDGKTVPRNTEKFITMVASVKGKKAVEAVVFRKGKRRTLKDIQLAQRKTLDRWRQHYFLERFAVPNAGNLPFQNFGGKKGQVLLSISRSDESFNASYHEGELGITVNGKVDDGRAKPQLITIREGNETHRYKNLGDVPAKHRDRVNRILESVNRSGLREKSEEDEGAVSGSGIR